MLLATAELYDLFDCFNVGSTSNSSTRTTLYPLLWRKLSGLCSQCTCGGQHLASRLRHNKACFNNYKPRQCETHNGHKSRECCMVGSNAGQKLKATSHLRLHKTRAIIKTCATIKISLATINTSLQLRSSSLPPEIRFPSEACQCICYYHSYDYLLMTTRI